LVPFQEADISVQKKTKKVIVNFAIGQLLSQSVKIKERITNFPILNEVGFFCIKE